MSMITLTDAPAVRSPAKMPSFLGRFVAAMMESRQRQAQRAVASYLLLLDDEDLMALGHDRKSLAAGAPRSL